MFSQQSLEVTAQIVHGFAIPHLGLGPDKGPVLQKDQGVILDLQLDQLGISHGSPFAILLLNHVFLSYDSPVVRLIASDSAQWPLIFLWSPSVVLNFFLNQPIRS